MDEIKGVFINKIKFIFGVLFMAIGISVFITFYHGYIDSCYEINSGFLYLVMSYFPIREIILSFYLILIGFFLIKTNKYTIDILNIYLLSVFAHYFRTLIIYVLYYGSFISYFPLINDFIFLILKFIFLLLLFKFFNIQWKKRINIYKKGKYILIIIISAIFFDSIITPYRPICKLIAGFSSRVF